VEQKHLCVLSNNECLCCFVVPISTMSLFTFYIYIHLFDVVNTELYTDTASLFTTCTLSGSVELKMFNSGLIGLD